MSAVKDYIQSGGIIGKASHILETELKAAETDKSHVLYKVASARRAGNTMKYEKLLTKALVEAAFEEDSPLVLPAMLAFKMPLSLAGYDRAAEMLTPEACPRTYFDMARLGFFNLIGQ